MGEEDVGILRKDGKRMRFCHLCNRNLVDIDNSRLVCDECENDVRERHPKNTTEGKAVDDYLNAFNEKFREIHKI